MWIRKGTRKRIPSSVFFRASDGFRLTGTTAFFYRMAARNEEARKSMPEGDFRDW